MTNLARISYYLIRAMQRLRWKRQKLRSYQEKHLRHIVRYAYKSVPFYHEEFKAAGINPQSVKTLEDLNKLPIIRKDKLRHEKPQRMISSQFNINKLRKVRTSGSTGEPFEFYLSGDEDDWRKSIYMRANISCGQRARDRWVVITNPRHFWETTTIQRRLRLYAQTCISLFDDIYKQITLVRKIKPDVLDGYSSCILSLAKGINRQKKLNKVHPRIIFGTAELIDATSINYIEQAFQANYYDQLGCAELDRTAWVCPDKAGYHMDVDSVITQIIARDGSEVSAGERGEIVYTSLFNHAMPFIRYATGDVATPSDQSCPCGRVLPLMKMIEGRKDSFVFLPDGRIISPRALTVAMNMFKHYKDIDRFRIIQKSINDFRILIKMRQEVCKNFLEIDLVNHLLQTLKILDSRVNLQVSFVPDIPLDDSGKLSVVVSRLKHRKLLR